jgi:hypothetical protein
VILTALCWRGHLDLAAYDPYLTGKDVDREWEDADIPAAVTDALAAAGTGLKTSRADRRRSNAGLLSRTRAAAVSTQRRAPLVVWGDRPGAPALQPRGDGWKLDATPARGAPSLRLSAAWGRAFGVWSQGVVIARRRYCAAGGSDRGVEAACVRPGWLSSFPETGRGETSAHALILGRGDRRSSLGVQSPRSKMTISSRV